MCSGLTIRGVHDERAAGDAAVALDPATRPRTAVVVLCWNNAPDTLECLHSLPGADDGVTFYVVDNGSTDGSADALARDGRAGVLVRTGANLGYTGGNNVGLRQALADGAEYVAVLNNDTVVPGGVLERLVDHLATAPDRATLALSPVIVRHDDPTTPWFRGGVVDRGWPRHLQPHDPPNRGPLSTTEVLTGCCIVAHRDVWERVGLFDQGFFLIFEDSDWSLRARARGVRLAVANDCTIRHKVSRSFRGAAMTHLATYYFVRNGLRFVLRHHRRHLARFVATWVARPALRAARRGDARGLAVLVVAAVAPLVRPAGPAPRMVQRLAGVPVQRAVR